MERESLLDMVRRLLALGESPNEHEARAAVAKAEKLMREYHLAIEEVEGAEREGRWSEERIWEGQGRGVEQEFVLDVLVSFFFVQPFHLRRSTAEGTRREVWLFGEPQDVAVARFVFTWLSRTFRQLWRAHAPAQRRGPRTIREFYCGLAVGLFRALKEARGQEGKRAGEGVALVATQSRLEKAFLQSHPESKELGSGVPPEVSQAMMAGAAIGSRIKVPVGMGVEGNRPLLEGLEG